MCCLIIVYCKSSKSILKKLKRVTVVDAHTRGNGFDKDTKGIKDGLYKSKSLSVNWLLGVREVFYKFKNWILIIDGSINDELVLGKYNVNEDNSFREKN